MLDEYLALGGVELGNNARAYNYASCLSCCAGLLKLPGCDGIHDATTGFTDAEWEWQERARNVNINPAFEPGDSTVAVRINLARDPRGAGSPGNNEYQTRYSWPVSALPTTSAPFPGGPQTAMRLTCPSNQTGAGRCFDMGGNQDIGTPGSTGQWLNYPVSAGIPVKVSAWVRSNRGTTAEVRLRLHDGAGAWIAPQEVGPAFPVNANGWNLIEHTYVPPATGYLVARVNNGSVAWVTGDVWDQTAVYIGTPGAYFDGTGLQRVPDPDLEAAWSGPANGSPSFLGGVSVRNVVGHSAAAIWSSKHGGSVRIIPTSADNNTYAELSPAPGLLGEQTLLGTIHLDAPLSGTLHERSRALTSASPVVWSTPKPDNAVGSYPQRLLATPTSQGRIIFMHGGAIGSGDVYWTHGAVVAGAYDGEWFDGSNLPADADPTVWRSRWLGEEGSSASILEENTLIVPAESAEPPYSCGDIELAPWYDASNPFSEEFAGFYLLSVKGITDGTMTAGVTESVGYGGVIGTPHYATRSVRVRSMLVGCGRAAAHYGLAWLKAALGESFCSRHGDACGTSDLAFFIDCPPTLEPGETDYAAATAPYRRYLHDVACTSSPIIQEEYETPSGAYVVIVEYILTAESPFVWGQTVEAESTGAVLTAYDDIPFNLMRRPSGEQGDGVPAVVATQYAFNGSAEYGGSASALPTGWARSQTNISAGLTDAKSSDIAAVGPNSARTRLLATGPVTNGSIRLYYDVALGSLPAGSSPSVSLWAAALVFAGAPTNNDIAAEVEWRTASASVGTSPLGVIPANGGNISAPGLNRPPTATIARLSVTLRGINAVAGDDIRLYADAFGLTVP